MQGTESYFTSLGYTLPPGESLADWLIDISTGRISMEKVREVLEVDHETSRRSYRHSIPPRLWAPNESLYPNGPPNVVSKRTSAFEMKNKTTLKDVDIDDIVSRPPGGKGSSKYHMAKIQRELLYLTWERHFDNLDSESRTIYNPPEKEDPPPKVATPSFWVQVGIQMERISLLAWRNRETKLVENVLLTGAVALITWFEGTASLTNGISNTDLESMSSYKGGTPFVPWEAYISGKEETIVDFFPSLFEFATTPAQENIRYAVSVGVITSVLIALSSARSLTGKKLEFNRDAGSGISVNAYFTAINVFTSMDLGIQLIITTMFAQWLRHSFVGYATFYTAFLSIAWVTISWALLIQLIVPPQNVNVLLAVFIAFFGLLFSGAMPPVDFKGMQNISYLFYWDVVLCTC